MKRINSTSIYNPKNVRQDTHAPLSFVSQVCNSLYNLACGFGFVAATNGNPLEKRRGWHLGTIPWGTVATLVVKRGHNTKWCCDRAHMLKLPFFGSQSWRGFAQYPLSPKWNREDFDTQPKWFLRVWDRTRIFLGSQWVACDPVFGSIRVDEHALLFPTILAERTTTCLKEWKRRKAVLTVEDKVIYYSSWFSWDPVV